MGKFGRLVLAMAGAGLWLAAGMAEGAAKDMVTGTALYRERIALPPNAVFTAVLQVVSRANAPAEEIGRAVLDPAGHPPYRFEIPFDRSRISGHSTYAVRASITVDGQLMFTSDTVHPVLPRGAPQSVEIVMKPAARHESMPGPAGQLRAARWHGMFTYFADAARFQECRTGRTYPVAMEGEYLAAERAYLAERAEPGAPLRMTVDGVIAMRPKMEGEAEQPTLVILAVVETLPGQTCADEVAPAELLNTFWVAERIGEFTIEPAEGRREPHLVLMPEESRYRATAGCNSLGGPYLLDGQRLRLLPAAATSMACPPPVGDWEGALKIALEATVSWKIEGVILSLLGRQGEELARFRAVNLK